MFAAGVIARLASHGMSRTRAQEKSRAPFDAAPRYRALLKSGASNAHLQCNPWHARVKVLNHWCCGTAALWL